MFFPTVFENRKHYLNNSTLSFDDIQFRNRVLQSVLPQGVKLVIKGRRLGARALNRAAQAPADGIEQVRYFLK